MYSKFGQFIHGKWQPSEKNETYDVINPETEEWEVVELPSNLVIKTFSYSEEAYELTQHLNSNKPFGDYGFPNFLSHK